MSQYRKDLPPLDNLLFFHAAANNPSLSSAAQELFVTQAAVSKRIQRFEDWLGTPLFSRDNNSLQITETGKVLAADVEIALDFLKLAIAKKIAKTNRFVIKQQDKTIDVEKSVKRTIALRENFVITMMNVAPV